MIASSRVSPSTCTRPASSARRSARMRICSGDSSPDTYNVATPACSSRVAHCNSSVDFPIPGSPPTSTTDPGTMPPPNTKSNSLSPVGSGALARWPTGLNEFDFVLGGGIVPGSVVLVGGEPGIGKSTLLLQCATRLEHAGVATLYVSGEESPEQIRMRADRLADDAGLVHVLGETRLEAIMHHAAALKARVVFVHSIQTTYTHELEGAPGNVGQGRECAARLMRFAKEAGPAVVLVGHVTKGGGIAAPRTLEHIVDTVLYFEGDPTLDHRILRAVKNRFGSVDEIGVFRMTGQGLEHAPDPAAAFLAGPHTGVAGSAVTALMG